MKLNSIGPVIINSCTVVATSSNLTEMLSDSIISELIV